MGFWWIFKNFQLVPHSQLKEHTEIEYSHDVLKHHTVP